MTEVTRQDERANGLKSQGLKRLPAMLVFAVAATLALLVVIGVMWFGATRVPDDTEVDARLAAMRAKMEERRRQSVAGLADRIVHSQMGRRAQEALLRGEEDILAPSTGE